MSILGYAVDRVMRTIPRQIISTVYGGTSEIFGVPKNPAEEILNQVIRSRVVADTDVVGGIETDVAIEKCIVEKKANNVFVIAIPKESVNNKSVSTILGIRLGASNVNAFPNFSTNRLVTPTTATGTNAMNLFNSAATMPLINFGETSIIGENIFLVRNITYIPQMCFVRCIVNNNDDLSNLSPALKLLFANLCTLAVKADIYNKMIVTIDQARVEGGREIGAFKNIVESYADAEQMYLESIPKWGASIALADRSRNRAMLKLMVGSIG